MKPAFVLDLTDYKTGQQKIVASNGFNMDNFLKSGLDYFDKIVDDSVDIADNTL